MILFGSRAAGRAHPYSDYDLVVVTPDLAPDRPPGAHIRAALRGIDAAMDLVVVTPAQWARMRVVRQSAAYDVCREGIVVRDAA